MVYFETMQLVLGEIYKRSHIHDLYGGNRQSGISPSAKEPYIFIFTGSTGAQYGYKDQWLNDDVFSYSGEGQTGDMRFTKGNLALREHLQSGRRVFLFQYKAKGLVEYVSELQFIDCDYYETHDNVGNTRIGIKFFFRKVGALKYQIPNELNRSGILMSDNDDNSYYKKDEPSITEREGLVVSRVGQGAYRKSLLHRWEYKCAVTGYQDTRILIASHIVSWKASLDAERLDVDNGILLSPDYDALFDRHLISFDHSGKILLKPELSESALNDLGITGKEKIHNLSGGNKAYLDRHNYFFVKNETN